VNYQPPTSAVTSHNSGLLDPHRSHHRRTHIAGRVLARYPPAAATEAVSSWA